MAPHETLATESLDLDALSTAVTAAQLSDSLDALGIRNQVLGNQITALDPGYRAYGRARTIEFVPVDEPADVAYARTDPYADFIRFMDDVQPGDFLVVATAANGCTAYWGELFSAAAIGRGAVGVVCDGPARDRARIAALGFPVFSAGTRPVDFRARMRVSGVQHAVTVAGVDIRPGDFVLADDDGIVVIPQDSASAAIRLANQRLSTESSVLQELLAGSTIAEVWTKYGVL